MSTNPTPVSSSEPVVLYTSLAVVVSTVAAVFGIVVDPGTLGNAIAAVVAVAAPIVAAFKARAKVTPVA